MGYIKVEQGKSLYAEVELAQPTMMVDGVETPQPSLTIGGTFTIDGGDIRLKLVKFEEYFHVDDDAEIVVRTEKNWFATMRDNVVFGGGQTGHTDKVAYNQSIISNTTLVGWEPWRPEYRVRRTNFRVLYADYLLRHYPTYDALANTALGRANPGYVFDVPILGGHARLAYRSSGTGDSDYPREVWPVVELEFDEPVSLERMRQQVITLIRFLSAMACQPLHTSEQIASQLSHVEWVKEVGDKLHPADYSIYYYNDQTKAAERDVEQVSLHGSFALMHDDAERDAFVECMTAWFVRDADWEGANSAMMDALSLKGVMNPTRLLKATKWIEATPGTKSEKAMQEGHIAALASLISRAAMKLGYGKLQGRLKNSLGQIAREQNTDRFLRLVRRLQTQFGTGVVGEDLAAWVAEAFTLRGKVAHGPLLRQTEQEYELFAKAVHAAECFAYLMLINALPMADSGRKRAASATLVEYYRVGIKGSLPKDFKKAKQ